MAEEVGRRQDQGKDWLAYATGGSDLVEQLADELAGADGRA